MVRGERVCGFVVTELLGSGRSGLLYLLEDAGSGQAAVLRTLVPDDDQGPTRFTEEGLRFLPGVSASSARLVRAELGDGTPVELLMSRGRGGPIRALAATPAPRAAGVLAVGLLAAWLAAAVAPGPSTPEGAAPDAELEVDADANEPPLGAPAPDDGPCPPEAIWRQDVFFALGELDRLAQENPRVRSIHRARSKALLRLMSGPSAGECHRARAVLAALKRELEQRSRPAALLDGKRQPVPSEPSNGDENAVSSGAP